MERSKPELDSAKQSKVNLMDMSLGCRVLESKEKEVVIEYFRDWPPQKTDGSRRLRTWWRKGIKESSQKKLLSSRLWEIDVCKAGGELNGTSNEVHSQWNTLVFGSNDVRRHQ